MSFGMPKTKSPKCSKLFRHLTNRALSPRLRYENEYYVAGHSRRSHLRHERGGGSIQRRQIGANQGANGVKNTTRDDDALALELEAHSRREEQCRRPCGKFEFTILVFPGRLESGVARDVDGKEWTKNARAAALMVRSRTLALNRPPGGGSFSMAGMPAASPPGGVAAPPYHLRRLDSSNFGAVPTFKLINSGRLIWRPAPRPGQN